MPRHYSKESWCLTEKAYSMPVKFISACYTMRNSFAPIANLKLSCGWYDSGFSSHHHVHNRDTCLSFNHTGKINGIYKCDVSGAPTHVNVCAERAVILRRATNVPLKLAPDQHTVHLMEGIELQRQSYNVHCSNNMPLHTVCFLLVAHTQNYLDWVSKKYSCNKNITRSKKNYYYEITGLV